MDTAMAAPAGRQLLADARGFVSAGWCQYADARNRDGAEVDPWDDDAVAWSLLGALVAALEREAASRGEIPFEELAASLYALAGVIEVESLSEWNDTVVHTQSDVVGALAEAEAQFRPLWISAASR
jgi:hypothetical protein